MPQVFRHSFTKTLTVAVAATQQDQQITAVRKGDRISAATIRKLALGVGTTGTFQIFRNNGGTPVALGSAVNVFGGTAGDMADSGIAAETLMTVDDSLFLRYVPGATPGATAPVGRVNLQISRNRGDI